MSINPGVGYTLNAGSGSFNLTVNAPFQQFDEGGGSPATGGINVAPGQLSTQTSEPRQFVPWQMAIVTVNGNRYLRIAQGTASYTVSNMPEIKTGYFGKTKEALFTKVQICPSDMRTASIYPAAGQDPYSDTKWMDEGFLLPDEDNALTLYAFKWDVAAGTAPFSDSDIVNTGRPACALIGNDNGTDYNKIHIASSPSIYEQTTNVQKMSGYDAASTELEGDWGYCHTTWVNPRKFGYGIQTIGWVKPVYNAFDCTISTVQVGVPALTNAVQEIRFTGTGFGMVNFKFSFVTIVDGEPVTVEQTSTVPFNVDDIYSVGGVIRSDEFALARCLTSIPGLVGNFSVSKAGPGLFYVTFVNKLQQEPIINLMADISAVTVPSFNFEVVQYVTGNVDLTNYSQSGMNQLMDEANKDEADDPYNQNKDGDPAWKDISNRAKVIACDGFSGDVITEGVTPIDDGATDNNPSFFLAGSCSAGGCDFPFQVKHDGVVAEEDTYTVCSGAVNNNIPVNMDATITGDGYIWVEVGYDTEGVLDPTSIIIYSGSSLPEDTDSSGFIALAQVSGSTVTQFVTGSLWVSRIKVGTLTAKYFYSRV